MSDVQPLPMRGRFVELDSLRGIAAIFVVLLHYTSTFWVHYPQYGEFPYPVRLGRLGVHLFFIISGFVILMTARRRTSPVSFVKARLIRLYPTYWVCLGLTVFAMIVTPIPDLSLTGRQIAVNATMLQVFVGLPNVDYVYWTLARELIFYALITVALWLTAGRLTDRFVTRFALGWSAVGMVLLLADAAVPSSVVDQLVQLSVAHYAPLFGLGMILYVWRESGELSRIYWPLVTMAICAQALQAPVNEVIGLLVIILAVTWVMSREQVRLLRWGPLIWFGTISYPLYLLHQNIGFGIIDRTIAPLGQWGSRFLAFAVVVLLAWVVHELVELRLTRAIKRFLRV